MYFPREFKDQRIAQLGARLENEDAAWRKFTSELQEENAKLERQLEIADSLHKADCDDFYHLFKDELEEAQDRIAELEAKVAELEQLNDKLSAFSLSLIVDRSRPMDFADYYAEPKNTEPTTIDQDDKDWPF